MTFQKIKSGIPPFDNLFQGLYLGRPTLLSGKRRSGTSTLALRFLSHVLRIGEKILLFTEESPDHVTLEAHGLETDISEAIRNEQIDIVPYDRHLPLLPFPEALDELRGMVSDRNYSFVVFDPVMPWLAAPADRLEERLSAFFGLLEETSATTVLVLRHPASPLARRLFDEVSERCAICLNATRTGGAPPALEVTKYMGAPPEKCPVTIQLGAVTPDASPILPSRAEGMTLQELQKSTQRLQVNIPSPLLSSPLPASANAAPGFPSPNPAAGRGNPRAARLWSGEPVVAPLPLGLSRSAPQHAAPFPAPHPASFPAPHAAPFPVPHPAPFPAPPARTPSPAAVPPAPAASQAPAVAPMPSPFHSHEAKAATQPVSFARLLDHPEAVPRRAAPHAIRFSDAEPAATRPRETAPAPSPARPRPVPEPAVPEHPIRFSDIIQ